jgi:hypothetical protein
MKAIPGRCRPAGLREVTLLMCLFSIAALVWSRPPGVSTSVFYVAYGACVLSALVVLWHFWNGKNWARWLVLATSVLALLNLSLLGEVTVAEKVLIVAEGLLALWLLYWLNTRAVRAFYRKTEAGAVVQFTGRIALRSHLEAGCCAVAGITILSAGYLFPIVLRGAGESTEEGIFSIAIVVGVGLSLALSVWLLIYVPLSSLADRLASTTVSRVKLSALLSTLVLAGLTVGAGLRFDTPILVFLMASVVLGVGGALYTFFRAGIARQLSARRGHVS